MAVDAMDPKTETPSVTNGGDKLGLSVEADVVQLPHLGLIESVHRPWWTTFGEEIGELFHPTKLPPPPQYRPAAPGELTLGPMVVETLQEPWFRSLPRFFRVSKEQQSLPPLELTSKPVNVKSIWGAYDNRKQGGWTSAAIHALVILAIFGFRTGGPPVSTGTVTLIIPVDISPYLAQLRVKPKAPAGDSGGGGGGGQRMPLPPSRGRLPRFSMEQLAPPSPIVRNENPKLSVEPTVVVPDTVNLAQIDSSVFGDPLGQIGPPSAGPGSGGGIGTGRGGGVGSGRGAGVGPGSGGGIGGGVYRVGGGVSAPRLTRKVEPEYSEEARKAKYQGTVVLAVEVWPDGKAHNVRVIRSLGLGLDEKAIQAVQQWEFVPGKKDGSSVKVSAQIEVNFRLL